MSINPKKQSQKMKKVDFRKIVIKDVEGNDVVADFQKQLGNQLYMQGRNIEECELGKAIYHDGEVELNQKQEDVVRRFIQPWAFVIRSAIEETLNKE